MHRRAGGDGLPAGEAAEAERDARGVAGHDLHLVDADAELRRGDLRHRGAEALAHRGRAGEHRDLAGARDAHEAGLERPAAGALHAMRQADAEIAAARSRLGLALREIVPAGGGQRLGLAGRIVAAVVFHRRAGARLQRLLVRHLARRDEIAPPHLGAVELHLARDQIEQPLHRERRLRIAGAAHRRHRRLVAHGDGDFDREPRHDVGPAHGRRRVVGNVRVLDACRRRCRARACRARRAPWRRHRPRSPASSTGRARAPRW